MPVAAQIRPGMTPKFPPGIYGIGMPDNRIRFFRFEGPDAEGRMTVWCLFAFDHDGDVEKPGWADFAYVMSDGRVVVFDDFRAEAGDDLRLLMFLIEKSADEGRETFFLVRPTDFPDAADHRRIETQWLKLSGDTLQAMYVARGGGLDV